MVKKQTNKKTVILWSGGHLTDWSQRALVGVRGKIGVEKGGRFLSGKSLSSLIIYYTLLFVFVFVCLFVLLGGGGL